MFLFDGENDCGYGVARKQEPAGPVAAAFLNEETLT